MTDITLCDLIAMAFHPITRRVRRVYYTWAEKHFLICSEAEAELANHHSRNVGHFQKRAALARSLKVNS